MVRHVAGGDGDGDGGGGGKDNIDGHGRGVTRAGTGYYRQLNAPTAMTDAARALNAPTAVTDAAGSLNAPTAVTEAAAPRDEDNPFSAMSPRRNTVSVIVRTYKAAVTRACRVANQGEFAWQQGYYEHVVRSPVELGAARRYIRDNQSQWALDCDNPSNMVRLSAPTTVAGYLEDLAKYQ